VSWPFASAPVTGTTSPSASGGKMRSWSASSARVVGPLDVGPSKTREFDAQSGGAQADEHVGVEADEVAQRRLQTNLVLGQTGIDHLAGERALPHEVVHGEFVATELGVRLVEGAKRLAGGRIASCASCAFFTLRS